MKIVSEQDIREHKQILSNRAKKASEKVVNIETPEPSISFNSRILAMLKVPFIWCISFVVIAPFILILGEKI